MDDSYEEELTQPATQPLPPHNGIPPSDGQDYRGVVCFLHPCSPAAIAIVRRASTNGKLVVRLPVPEDGAKGRAASDESTADDPQDQEPTQIETNEESTTIDLALRHDPGPKDPEQGFLFGRNPFKCDILMIDNPNNRRISNTHFRIYVNARGALMLEDKSTNGTWVDDKLLSKTSRWGQKRVLSPGSVIFICPGKDDELVRFVVRVPRESGRGLKPVQGPDSMNLNQRLAGANRSPAPNVGLPRVGDAPPGLVQSPQQRNVAALKRNAGRGPDEAHRRPEQIETRDVHTIREPSGSISWGGDHKYMLASQIGKGAFATVNKAYERQNGNVVAVKSIAKRTFATQIGKENLGVKKEIDILERLKHPNIVEYIGYFEDDTHVYVVMEFIEHGDLNNYLNYHSTMPEHVTKQVVTQVLRGLKYIHEMGISHRDLKPDNILIASEDPMIVKISDFGLAKMVNNEQTFLRTFCGTMLYLAPEVFPGYMSAMMAEAQGLDGNIKRKRLPADEAGPPKGKKNRRPYNQAVDMWSLGCVIYCLLCGSPPFEGKNQDEMCRLVTRGMFDETKLRSMVGADNDNCVDFLGKLLQVRPEMRIMETEALRHPWIFEENLVESASMEYDEDEVLGVGYDSSQVQPSARQVTAGDEDDDEDAEDSGEDTPAGCSDEEDNTSSLPTPRAADKRVETELQGGMSRVSFSQVEGDDMFDAHANSQSSDYASSGNEVFESLINSRQEFTQGETGISVIERAKADVSLKGSSGVFPAGGLDGSDSEDDGSSQLTQRLGEAFEYRGFRRTKATMTTPRRRATENKFSRLALNNNANAPPCTPPSVKPNQGQSTVSPFSFANNAHFNFSPESLGHQSARSTQNSPRAPPPSSAATNTQPRIFFHSVPQPEDDELPATQSVCSQESTTHFRVPLLRWGRLLPLPGSVSQEPIALVEQLVSIGRGTGCTIRPDDIRISKWHFALQINHLGEREMDPNQSRIGEWRPQPDMVVMFQAAGRCGVYVNGRKYGGGERVGRLYDGDELVLFKDTSGDKVEIFGYKVELTIGRVRRDGPPEMFTDSALGHFPGATTIRYDVERGAGVSMANTEIPGGGSEVGFGTGA